MHSLWLVLYMNYSTHSAFELPMQSGTYIYVIVSSTLYVCYCFIYIICMLLFHLLNQSVEYNIQLYNTVTWD